MKEFEHSGMPYSEQIIKLLQERRTTDLEPVAVFWESPVIPKFVEHHFAWFDNARDAAVYAEQKMMQMNDYGMRFHIITTAGSYRGGLLDL